MRPDTSYDEANAIADSFSPGDVQAIYLPYLYSDMAHPARRAGFWNLSPGDTWREMLRAVYEGVAVAHREEIDRLKGAGCAISGARLSGGAANADAWGRVFAGALGIPLETTAEKQVGVLGAAMSAGIATGLFATPEEAVSAMVRPGKRYEPADSALYEEKYQKFRKAVCD